MRFHIKLWVFSLCLVLSAGAEQSDIAIDLQKGIGPVTFQMEDSEIHMLGPVDERYYFHHSKAWGDTVVWPEDPSSRIHAVLADPPDERPAFVTIDGYGSKYVLPNGLRLGSSLAEVEKANGRPFAFRGLAQDDCGEVLSWRGGQLAQTLPGVTLYFRSSQDLSENLDENSYRKICGPFSRSDAAHWKNLSLEVYKIQLARPSTLQEQGPAFDPGETVGQSPLPASLKARLEDPDSIHCQLYRLSNSPYAVLLETNLESFPESTSLSLWKVGPQEQFELVQKGELSEAWQPEAPLTVYALADGGPEAALALSEPGSLMQAVVCGAEVPLPEPQTEEESEQIPVTSFSVVLGGSGYPAHRLVRGDDGRLEVRQIWKEEGEEPRLGPVDYRWDGRDFRFPDGSRKR